MGTCQKESQRTNESVLIFIASPTRIVLVKDKKYELPLWKMPGGGVETTDINHSAAAVRECKEETGIRLLPGEITHFSREPHDDGHYQHIFIAQLTEEKLDTRLKIGNENGHPLMVAAFPKSEVPTMLDLLEQHRPLIVEVLKTTNVLPILAVT